MYYKITVYFYFNSLVFLLFFFVVVFVFVFLFVFFVFFVCFFGGFFRALMIIIFDQNICMEVAI